jgi:uncharacterized protein (DUF2267 family)
LARIFWIDEQETSLMPMPQEYFHASRDFDKFMEDAKRISMLTSHHQAYTMVEAVLHAFRAHLSFADAMKFADFLPPVLRAIFVQNWDVSQPVTPFPNRAGLQREILGLRHNHNMSTETAVEDVAQALSLNTDGREFARVLSKLPAEAAAFWRLPSEPVAK